VPFRDTLGHRHLLRLLARSVATASVPQSLIFAGPDGVGKRRTALALAQVLNCHKPVISGQRSVASGQGSATGGQGRGTGDELAIDGCGECSACRRIARGSYPDVLVVEPEASGSIKIEQIREVVAQTAYRPFEGRRRVIVIDEADAMGADAQDALLKSLEEPPPATVFVLVSARSDTLLPTVRSRCSRLRFGRLGPAEIARALVRDHGYTEDDARTMAALAGGSLGRALEAASSDLDEVRGAACRALRQVAGATDARGRLDSVRELVGGRAAGTTVASDREGLATRLTVLLSLFRDLAILSTRAHGDALANLDLTSELEGLSGFYDRDRAVRAFAAADRALSALRRNASPKIVADWLVLQL
jgi:DNA polymerase III subunit delta'